MSETPSTTGEVVVQAPLSPAQPLWRVAPTRADDGRCLADFMMLIPRLGSRPKAYRDGVAQAVREVCEAYGDQVAFADINLAINVLWVSVAAEPGLGGRVAAAVRRRVPEALLIGGHLAATTDVQTARTLGGSLRCWLRTALARTARLTGPRAP